MLSRSSTLRRLATTARETGQTVTETVHKTKGQDGRIMTTLTKVRTNWEKMSPWQKYGGGIYLAGGLTYAGVRSYNDGKSELLTYRQRQQEGKRAQFENEWEATLYGCRKDAWDHFAGALVWPFALVRNSMPKLVMMMNPPELVNPPETPPTSESEKVTE